MTAGRRRAPPPTPMGRALRWLSIRDRSEAELRRKLREAEVAPEQIDATLERLRSLGYLDDERFARSRARALLGRGRHGPRAVSSKLAQAGLARDSVAQAVSEAMASCDELAMARGVIDRKYPQAPGNPDARVRAKAMRFLLGRGFNASVARQAVRSPKDS